MLKHIHRYILKNFLKTFSITFLASIFILVMQFMFRYVDDFVGKGMGALVLLEFLFYAALSVIPLALPLSILLGSLMTFGNLGEKLELLAMKAAGISLFKIMKSLIILIAFVSIGSFYFANNILPITQVRMWGLLFSIQEASPELEIPQGAFYGGITGRNVYAETKRDGLLLDVVIYDYSRGFNNTGIILADTGRLRLTEDKKQLVLELYNGECFENLQDADNSNNYSNNKIIPYRRETFARKELVIDFDANFKELSNSYLEDQYVAKNVDQLNETVDSIKVKIVDHAKLEKERKQKNTYFNRSNTNAEELTVFREPDLNLEEKQTLQAHFARLININKSIILKAAQKNATQVTSRQDSYDSLIQWFHNEMRRHEIEKYKRYTLAFACFIFLFIGAPLGAIIRKGGMGMPVVLSTVLFIIYYIIDNTGYKMAREGVWEVWQGMWLSAFILLPFGILLTYMAATESSIMNGESYIMVFKKFFSKENVIFAKIKKLKQNK